MAKDLILRQFNFSAKWTQDPGQYLWQPDAAHHNCMIVPVGRATLVWLDANCLHLAAEVRKSQTESPGFFLSRSQPATSAFPVSRVMTVLSAKQTFKCTAAKVRFEPFVTNAAGCSYVRFRAKHASFAFLPNHCKLTDIRRCQMK